MLRLLSFQNKKIQTLSWRGGGGAEDLKEETNVIRSMFTLEAGGMNTPFPSSSSPLASLLPFTYCGPREVNNGMLSKMGNN